MSNSKNLVFIYSIPRPSALGIDQWVSDSSGVRLKKTKVGRTADYIRALYSPTVGGLANYISYTPWIENGEPQLDEAGKPQMLQTKMERKWNLPTGHLHNRPLVFQLSFGKPPEDLSFFQQQRWKLADGATVLDRSKMEDDLGYYVMLASSKVANSEREWKQHKFPKAQWYIALENESDEIRYEKSEARSKAYAALHATDMTEVVKRKIVSLLQLTYPSSVMSQQQVHNTLVAYIDNSTNSPNSNIEKFHYYVNLLKTPDGREKFEALWTLRQAIELRIISDKQDIYMWTRSNGVTLPIGNRLTEALEFLTDPRKSEEHQEIQEQINYKLKL